MNSKLRPVSMLRTGMKARRFAPLLLPTMTAACVVMCGCKNPSSSSPSVSSERTSLKAPYPASSLFREIAWHWETHRTAAPGSDLWPITWGPDGNLYAAWGDGGGFGGSDSDGRVALGFARIEGGPLDFRGVNVNGGKNPENPASFPDKGKTAGILYVDGKIFALINLQDGAWPAVTHVLAWSTNAGATWIKANWVFTKGVGLFQPAKFLNFGPNYTRVPEHLDGFVYMLGPKQPAQGHEPTEILLARVPKDQLLNRESYQFFAGHGRDDQPLWNTEASTVKAIFKDPNGTTTPTLAWDAPLRRFLLTSFHTGPGQLGMFEGPQPWGPWRTVAYYEHWGQMGCKGEGLTCDFPQKWMSADGLTLWSVFSAYGPGAKVGIQGHDRFNVVQAVLKEN